MANDPETDRLGVSEHVVARELDISVHTLRKDRREQRRIPFFKIGSTVRYNMQRVREALRALEVGAPIARKPRVKNTTTTR